jgi:hypothetical protein
MMNVAQLFGFDRKAKHRTSDTRKDPEDQPAESGWLGEKAAQAQAARRSRKIEAAPEQVPDAKDDPACEMEGSGILAAARNRERTRCAQILGSEFARGNLALAKSIAFESTMTSAEAVRLMSSSAKGIDHLMADDGVWDRAFAKASAPAAATTNSRDPRRQ